MSSAKIAPFQMPEIGGDDAPADLRRYKRPVEPAFMKRGADGKRRAAGTDEEWAEEVRYRRELCFFELTDQSPSAYIDPALPLGAAAFNHLACECLGSLTVMHCTPVELFVTELCKTVVWGTKGA